MPIEPSNFWGSNHYENPPVTDDDIAKAEAHFGRKLPAEYIEIIRLQNGGYTQGFAFPTSVSTTWAEDHVPFDEMGGIVFGDVPMHSIMATDYMTEEWGLPPGQILLERSLIKSRTMQIRSYPAIRPSSNRSLISLAPPYYRRQKGTHLKTNTSKQSVQLIRTNENAFAYPASNGTPFQIPPYCP